MNLELYFEHCLLIRRISWTKNECVLNIHWTLSLNLNKVWTKCEQSLNFEQTLNIDWTDFEQSMNFMFKVCSCPHSPGAPIWSHCGILVQGRFAHQDCKLFALLFDMLTCKLGFARRLIDIRAARCEDEIWPVIHPDLRLRFLVYVTMVLATGSTSASSTTTTRRVENRCSPQDGSLFVWGRKRQCIPDPRA